MKGTVKALGSKPYGSKTMYSFKVDEDWYGCGSDDPKVSKGDLIEFDFTENGRWKNVDVKSISVLRHGTEVIKTSSRKMAIGGARDDYWNRKEERDIITQSVIQLQSSRNSAIALADLILKNNAVKLPEAQAKRMDVVVALVSDLTSKFEEEATAKRSGTTSEETVTDDSVEEETKEEEGIWNG